MVEYGVRPAIRNDLPRLVELFGLSLCSRAEGDSLVNPLGGDWTPHLVAMLKSRFIKLLVLECQGGIEGFALARSQVMTGPIARTPWWQKLMRRPRPRPIQAPYRAVWVDDLHLTDPGLQAGGAPALARAVKEWARHLRAHRIGITCTDSIPGGEQFCRELGMEERSRFYTVDLA